MDNINIEEYIKDLSPELQEKAHACKSTDELLKLADDNKIPLPDEALEAVAGGNLKSSRKKEYPGYYKLKYDIGDASWTKAGCRVYVYAIMNENSAGGLNREFFLFQDKNMTGIGYPVYDDSFLIPD